MKEFIEKLIGRLEEETVYDTFDRYKEEALINMSFERLEDIITQFAEEYNGYALCKTRHFCDYQFMKDDGWIPCSERLPEVNGWYLVTNELGVVQQQYWGASHWQKLRDDAVVAWRELPAPYQPKGE